MDQKQYRLFGLVAMISIFLRVIVSAGMKYKPLNQTLRQQIKMTDMTRWKSGRAKDYKGRRGLVLCSWLGGWGVEGVMPATIMTDRTIRLRLSNAK